MWAVMSLLCGIVVLCPVASLVAPILGVVGLLQIRRRADRRGRGLAVAGIVLGLAATGGWAAGAGWWHTHVRRPILSGPAEALRAGQEGDVGAFMAAFTPQVPATPRAEAMAFLDEVSGRYGRLLGWAQAPADDGANAAAPVDTRGLRLSYLYQFEAGPVATEAEFVVRGAQGRRLVLRFAWLALHDPERGDLVYPQSASDRLGYDPDSPSESSP
jgi:hypothetical protein